MQPALATQAPFMNRHVLKYAVHAAELAYAAASVQDFSSQVAPEE